jgi:putative two-component system response regulator
MIRDRPAPLQAPPALTQASFDPVAQMDRLLVDFGSMYRERNDALKEVVEAHHDALFRLAIAAEYKNNDTGVHIVRIGLLAEALALALGQSRPWSEMLRRAAPMHDIGKIGIPDAVLKKRSPAVSMPRSVS